MADLFLITGGNGNLARQLAVKLADQKKKILLTDISPRAEAGSERCDFVQGDIANVDFLKGLFDNYGPTHVLHMASMLSGSSENSRERAWQVNALASVTLLELSVKHGIKCFFFPSTAATYGSDITDPLPEDFPQWPENFYGVTKVAVERAGYYYYKKMRLNFRSLRLPFVISRFAPSGALTAYASHAFVEAVKDIPFSFPVRTNTVVSSIYVKDVINGIRDFIAAPDASLTRRVYNLHSCSPTAEAIALAIKARLPNFKYSFDPNTGVVRLTEAMPATITDRDARNDWNWDPVYDLDRMADDLISELQNV